MTSPATVVGGKFVRAGVDVLDSAIFVAASTNQWPLGRDSTSWWKTSSLTLHSAQVAEASSALRSVIEISRTVSPAKIYFPDLIRRVSGIGPDSAAVELGPMTIRKSPFGRNFTPSMMLRPEARDSDTSIIDYHSDP